jgi:DNA-binding IscR family transcriptional regulator
MRDIEGIDEILQIMYWLQGEGLITAASADDLARFLDWPTVRLESVLNDMVRLGLVEAQSFTNGAVRFILTAEGLREAARRFSEEFASMTRPHHGECGDADCECHVTGSVEDCRHLR